VTLEDGVFIGPHACLINDKMPRAITPAGDLKRDADWEVGKILVKYGASVGAGAVVLPQVTIGRFALVGAGAVVTKDVPDHGLVVGNPARLVGYVCKCGRRLSEEGGKGKGEEGRGKGEKGEKVAWCEVCGLEYEFPKEAEEQRGRGVEETGMRVMIPIARPLIGEEEKAAVLKVLESGQLAQGAKVREFEERFAAFCGVMHAIATSSGTTALHTALLTHGIGPGDEVITTPFTFIASANSILFTGAKPIFVDIEEDSYNINPALIEEKITSRTKAILPVHLYGNPCDMEAIMGIADRHGLIVIEDACQAHGASIYGKKVGSFGTGCFSFYPTKNITTAEGGMITTDDDGIAERARLIRQHGMRKRYYHEVLGYNFRLTDIQAAIGLAQLEKLPEWTAKRIANARYLTGHLPNVVTPTVRDGYVHVFHQYTIRVKGDRDAAVEKLSAAGIGTAIYYPLPVHQQPVYRQLEYQDNLPVAERVSREVISLPVHPALTLAELDKIVSEVNRL